jgi:hypothetical protein
LVAVNNYTESRYEGTVLIESDGTEVVRQYLEIPAAERDGWATVETEITLRSISPPLDVTASFSDMKATDQHTLDCSNESDSDGDVIYIQIEPEGNGPNLRLNLACYDGFPSDEAVQGGVNQS